MMHRIKLLHDLKLQWARKVLELVTNRIPVTTSEPDECMCPSCNWEETCRIECLALQRQEMEFRIAR